MRDKNEIAGLAEFMRRLMDQFRFDPALGRGYRIGKQETVPAGAGTTAAGTPPVVLYNSGNMDHVSRWRITLNARDPLGNVPALQGAGLRYIVTATQENETIPRTAFLNAQSNDAVVLYAPGRSLTVVAINENAFSLQSNFSVDEASAGLAEWRDQATFVALAAETELVLPNFCDWFEVATPSGAPLPRVRGYGPAGVLYYDEILTASNLQQVYRIPGLRYTLTPSGGGAGNYIALFHCLG